MEIIIMVDNWSFTKNGKPLNQRACKCKLCKERIEAGQAWLGRARVRYSRYGFTNKKVGNVCRSCVDKHLDKFQDTGIYKVPSRDGAKFVLNGDFEPNMTLPAARDMLSDYLAENETETRILEPTC